MFKFFNQEKIIFSHLFTFSITLSIFIYSSFHQLSFFLQCEERLQYFLCATCWQFSFWVSTIFFYFRLIFQYILDGIEFYIISFYFQNFKDVISLFYSLYCF